MRSNKNDVKEFGSITTAAQDSSESDEVDLFDTLEDVVVPVYKITMVEFGLER